MDPDDLGFPLHATKAGEVAILRAGRRVTLLRGGAARDFVAQLAGLPRAPSSV